VNPTLAAWPPARRAYASESHYRKSPDLPAHRNSKDAGRRGTNKDTVAVIVMFIGIKAHLIIKATTQVVRFKPARRTASGVHSSGV